MPARTNDENAQKKDPTGATGSPGQTPKGEGEMRGVCDTDTERQSRGGEDYGKEMTAELPAGNLRDDGGIAHAAHGWHTL